MQIYHDILIYTTITIIYTYFSYHWYIFIFTCLSIKKKQIAYTQTFSHRMWLLPLTFNLWFLNWHGNHIYMQMTFLSRKYLQFSFHVKLSILVITKRTSNFHKPYETISRPIKRELNFWLCDPLVGTIFVKSLDNTI